MFEGPVGRSQRLVAGDHERFHHVGHGDIDDLFDSFARFVCNANGDLVGVLSLVVQVRALSDGDLTLRIDREPAVGIIDERKAVRIARVRIGD